MKCSEIDPGIKLTACSDNHIGSYTRYEITEVTVSGGDDYIYIAKTFIKRTGSVLLFHDSSMNTIEIILPKKFNKKAIDSFFIAGRKYRFDFK